MFKQKITSQYAPVVQGPYSQGIILSDFIYLSGQLPLDPQLNVIVSDDIRQQTIRILENVKALLNEKSLEMRHIVKTTVYMTNLTDFDIMNEVYASYFIEPYPARSCVQVAALPKQAKVMIECFVINTLPYEKHVKKKSETCEEGDCCDGECCDETCD